MDQTRKQQVVNQFEELWDAGQFLKAGEMVYERIPRKRRPSWAAHILDAARHFTPPSPEIDAVLNFANTPDRWNDGADSKSSEAHHFFDAVRHVTLQQEKQKQRNRLYENLLFLAENTAKLTYNAYGFSAPFDHSAGWHIVPIAKNIADEVNSVDFMRQIKALLCDVSLIELENPVACNPHCHICKRNGLIVED